MMNTVITRGKDTSATRLPGKCHNRYHSVATGMMRPEIHRTVIERIANSSESSLQDLRNSLVKSLWRYTGVPTENIAIAADINTIINGLLSPFRQGANQITCVGPSTNEIVEATDDNVNVIPSLVDSSSKEISHIIPQSTLQSTQVLYLSSPNLINGEVYTVSQIRRIITATSSTLVVLNESLSEYCNATCVKLLEEFKNLVILRTFSEAFGIDNQPVAYALADKTLIDTLNKKVSPESIALSALITAGSALERQDVMRHSVNVICENRIYLTAMLRRLGAEVLPAPANFILMKIARPMIIMDILGRQDVTLVEFEYQGESQTFLRIPVGNERYCRGIIGALTRCPREYYKPIITSHNQVSDVTRHSIIEVQTDRNQSQYKYNTNTKEIQQ